MYNTNMNIADYTIDKYFDGNACLIDAHMHIGLIQNARNYASQIDGFKCISFGVLPSLYLLEKDLKNNNLSIGIGYHPWYVKDDKIDEELALCLANIKNTSFVGEIGLDFSEKHKAFMDDQIKVFTKICENLAKSKNKIVSIHAVKSAQNVIDILKQTGADKHNTIIMHWFSGSTEELLQAKQNGYYFSVGPKMLESKRGYEYIRQIPEEKMLTETDLPWDAEKINPQDHLKILNDFLIKLREIKSY